MGYSDSSNLKYMRDGIDINVYTAHVNKILSELSPYAVYMIDNQPFVLFFEAMSDKNSEKHLYQKIWNAQIPVVVICDSGTVTIYNGCTFERKSSSLIEVDKLSINSINEYSPFSYWEITNHDMWSKHSRKFAGETLNDCLLRNLSDITIKLKNEFNIPFATKIVLRLIFIRYLIDRGVDLDYPGFSSDIELSRKKLLSLLKDRDSLYRLFVHLKRKFNGNLFELIDEQNDTSLTKNALRVLADFLSGNIDTVTGQLSFFDLYDFNIIPVELISNIYEILLGKEQRNKDNAFYTPHYLVNYILDASLSPFVKQYGCCTVLDPSCGSGIFLVESYRRMVEKQINGNLFTEDDNLLQDILSNNIYGVDLNPDAIDVAIFSLYLTVLDYKNPKTLCSFQLPDLKGNNLFSNDFFDEDALESLKKISFDFIVGNPPWGKGNAMLVKYCDRRGYHQYLQNTDTCRAFILRSKDFCSSKTQCCLVLHSKMLYMQKTPSKLFRRFLLSNTQIIRLIELSSVRTRIFKNADAPAIILTYKFANENVLQNRFEYISMKPNIFFKLFKIIVVEKTDIKYVQQSLLKSNDWAWKTLVYGFTGDIDNIMNLKKRYLSLGAAIDEQSPKIIKGTGIKYSDKGDKVNKKDSSHLLGRDFLDSRAIDHFEIDLSRLSGFKKAKVESLRNEALYQAPYCLVKRGIDMTNYSMRSVYSEKSFIFREAFYAFKGTHEQKQFLLNLTGIFNSKVYSYFNLMLNSSLGIEREQRQMDEVLTYPFVYNEEIVQSVENIQALKSNNGFMKFQEDATSEIEELNKIILKSFGLWDNEFVDYAFRIQIPQLTEVDDSDVYRDVTVPELQEYGRIFDSCLTDIFSRSNKYIKILVYPKVAGHYCAFEVVIQKERPEGVFQVKKNADDNKKILTLLSSYKINDLFYQLKDTLYFKEDSFCIIKPNQYKNWHPAIAKLDLIEVVDRILTRSGGNR